ncbi:tripartite tricarboxylate transporter substrate binding protein [Comamonadaceae bacterium G21597-S1]|nr:tripartite tricarboxylate transporter substrate binding protein [Comamonadaceae bacterium G21597-S1]
MSPRSILSLIHTIVLSGLWLASAPALAQQAAWPQQTIRVIVPQPPGGGTDALARLIAERLQPVLGQAVVVENRTGAGGNIGTELVARAKPDGHTLLLTTNTHVTNVSFFSKLPYDPVKDFQPVTLVGSVPFVMGVNASSPYKTVQDLIDAAKARPGALSYASGGLGTPHQLASELFKSMTGTDLIHVPYKGSSPAMLGLLGNDVAMSISAINSMLPHIRSGKIRALAVAPAQRTPLLPDVPTIAEAVPLPGYEIDIWYGVLAPAGTPRAIVDRLGQEINKILRDPSVREKLAPQGLDPAGSTPERFAEAIQSDLVKYRRIAKDANIVPE